MFAPLVKYFMKKSLAESTRQTAIVRANNIQSIAVIGFFGNTQLFAEASTYVSQLRSKGIKKVDFYIAFKSKKNKEGYAAKPNEICFTPADFTLVGKYNSPELSEANKRQYDVLIDLTEGQSLAADVVIAKTHASWKAGRSSQERAMLFDFMLEQPEGKGLKDFIQNIDRYFLKLNSSNAA